MYRNPFKEGVQVVGDGYIGRDEEIRHLMRILSRNEKDGGILYSGMTRIGKTSLVKNCFALAEEKGLLEKNNIITISITVSTKNDFAEILISLADELYDALEERDLLDDYLQKQFNEIKGVVRECNPLFIYELDKYLKRILRRAKKNKIKIVVLLDEFDDAKRAFSYNNTEVSTNFQKFRDYASDVDYNCTFVLTSRVNISKIDASLPSGSNVRGVFSEFPMQGLTDSERDAFFEKIEECGAKLSESQKKDFIWYAGRSPYLFSKIACRILDRSEGERAEDISVQEIVNQCSNDFIAYFNSLINFMIADELFYKFVQVFFGPVYDLSERDVDALKQYGYIYHLENDRTFSDFSFTDGKEEKVFTYQTLSEYFLEYVRTRVNRDDSLKIWSELIDAEKRLRAVVETGLRSKYGEDSWIATLENLAESEEKGFLFNVQKANQFIASSKSNFGDAVDDNPLCVISIQALSNIIKAFWDDFYSVLFNPPYTELKSLLDELSQLHRVRNPLAHGTDDYLTGDDRARTHKYCKKIIYNLGKKRNDKHNRKDKR